MFKAKVSIVLIVKANKNKVGLSPVYSFELPVYNKFKMGLKLSPYIKAYMLLILLYI